MNFTIEIEREEDGRWIAEVMELPGVLVYCKRVKYKLCHAERNAVQ